MKTRDFRDRTIRIAFRPRDGTFSVAGAATDNDPTFLQNISDVLAK